MRHLTIVFVVATLLAACGDDANVRLGVEGASCTKTADCEEPLQCIGGICTNLAGPTDVQPESTIHFAETRTKEVPDLPPAPEDAGDTAGAGCKGNEDCSPPTPLCKLLSGECVECLMKTDCPEGQSCSNNQCVEGLCKPNEKWCEGNNAYHCNEFGDGYASSTPCGDGACVDGQCLTCEPGKKKCEGKSAMQCDSQGGGWIETEVCEGELGCVNGMCIQCYPGDKECQGNDAYECKQDGSEWELVESCTGQCIAGVCISACGSGDMKTSNVGCDYWAVDLDNALETDALGITYDAENQQFAVVVSNTSGDSPADVTISNSGGNVTSATVQPGALHTFNLPAANVAGSIKSKLAYRIESTIPIVAYQFNPSVNKGVFSNDASLLLPVHALGTEYLVISHIQDDPNFRGFVTVIGVDEGETQVTITPTGSVAPGNGVSGVPAGTEIKAMLQQYEVLNLETGGMGQDLTGTHIVADKKVAVFGGSECAGSPVTNQCENGVCKHWPQWNCNSMADCPALCCCDHLEQQMIPLHAWGTTYAVAHSKFRGNESDTFVVMSSKDDTTIGTNPQVASFPTLGTGEWFSFETKENFELTADKPVLLVQFLSGEHAPTPNPDTCMMGMCLSSMLPCATDQDCGPSALPVAGDAQTGDPAMILLPAVQQFRDEYIFLVPQFYSGGNFLSVVAPAGSSVVLDGAVISSGSQIGGGQYTATVVSVSEGVHTMKSEAPFSVMAHGYDSYVSYGYSAGMNVQVIQ